MKRAFGVVCIICVVYLAALMVGFYQYIIKEQNEIEQLILSYAIDYSADGAMAEVLNSRDINNDYMDVTELKIDPNVVLDSFLDIFCINYDMGRSAEAKKYVAQNFIPVACVAGFDGYYIARLQPIKSEFDGYYPGDMLENSRWDLIFGPKMPYTYTKYGKSFALNMGMEYAYTTSGGKYEGQLPELSKQAGLIKINRILSNSIGNAISSANQTNTNWEHQFFMPSQLSTYYGTNPIKGPSFIVLVQNVDLRTTKPISGFSISGSKVEKERLVVGYIRNEIKYYCYADMIPGLDTDNASGVMTFQDDWDEVDVLDSFTSVEEAAKAGYYCDLKYMK